MNGPQSAHPRLPAVHFVYDAAGQLLSRAALLVAEASKPDREDRYRWTGRAWDTDNRLP